MGLRRGTWRRGTAAAPRTCPSPRPSPRARGEGEVRHTIAVRVGCCRLSGEGKAAWIPSPPFLRERVRVRGSIRGTADESAMGSAQLYSASPGTCPSPRPSPRGRGEGDVRNASFRAADEASGRLRPQPEQLQKTLPAQICAPSDRRHHSCDKHQRARPFHACSASRKAGLSSASVMVASAQSGCHSA